MKTQALKRAYPDYPIKNLNPMKYLKSGVICLLLSFCVISSTAQSTPPLPKTDLNKPKLFADLAERIKPNVSDLDALLALPEGKEVNIHLGGSFNYRGTIVSKSDANNADAQSIVIKSINRSGATLTFTKVLKSEGGYMYRGRIISFQHIDAYDLELEEGAYVFVKKSLYDLFNE
jgi:hypothetical protein